MEDPVVDLDDPHAAPGFRRRALGQAEPLPGRVRRGRFLLARGRFGQERSGGKPMPRMIGMANTSEFAGTVCPPTAVGTTAG